MTVLLTLALLASSSAAPQEGGLRVIRGPGLEVYHAPEDSSRARGILDFLAGQPSLPALPPDLPDSVRVYLARSEAVFDSLTGGRIPEWGTGVAVPGARAMVLPTYGGDRGRGWSQARTLRHEWAHLGLHQRLEGLRVPRWFDEGYAEWASGGWNAGEGWRLRVALATGGGPGLDSLTLGWPRERVQAELAYMLAGSAVEYLARSSGERGLELLFRRWSELGSFDAALRRVYGVTPAQLEEDWREYVKSRYGWLFVLSHSVVFWLFLALVLLGMMWIRRRRNRRAMARLRATEPDDTPAWWEGPSPEERGGGGPRALRGKSEPRREGGGPNSRGEADRDPDPEEGP